MQRYANLHGDSGVAAFEIGATGIVVQFNDGSIYGYSDQVTGQRHVEEMKRLALQGHGLNGYISRHVGKRFAWKR